MDGDRIVSLSVRGLRSLESVSLDLRPLTVLIGENGSGKSSLIEAMELLHKAASGRDFIDELTRFHGGWTSLARTPNTPLSIGVTVRVEDGGELRYELVLGRVGNFPQIIKETLDYRAPDRSEEEEPLHMILRVGARCQAFDQTAGKLVSIELDESVLAIGAFRALPPNDFIRRAREALDGIDVHVPFDVRATWVKRENALAAPMRDSIVLQPATSLARLGANLANCYFALRNDFDDAHWRETIELVRLGLGSDVQGVNTTSDPAGGRIALTLQRGALKIPAETLADGELSYLAFVALARLHKGRSLLAFDEPDLHLHPDLLVRVVSMLEEMSDHHPVLIATHSDRLLDSLSDPQSIVLCQMNRSPTGPRTDLLVPDAAALKRWLEVYRGVGTLRAEGMQDVVLTSPMGPAKEAAG